MSEIETIIDFSQIGFPVSVTFVLPNGKELTFVPDKKIIDNIDIITVKKISGFFVEDSALFNKLKKKALTLLIYNPPDVSWLKCPYCERIQQEILDMLKTKRLREIAGHQVIQCPTCKRFYKIPTPPPSFLKYNLI